MAFKGQAWEEQRVQVTGRVLASLGPSFPSATWNEIGPAAWGVCEGSVG